jgi:hypothetical protein
MPPPACWLAAAAVSKCVGDTYHIRQIILQFVMAGNMGGEEEAAGVRSVAARVQRSCEGLVDFLLTVEQTHKQQQAEGSTPADAGSDDVQGAGGGGGSGSSSASGGNRLGDALTQAVREMGDMDWLVPPMLQPR